MKRKAKITCDVLRKDTVRAGDLLAAAAEDAFACSSIDAVERSKLIWLASMLKGATHVVIHDADELPDD
jgi:hypothetical protein